MKVSNSQGRCPHESDGEGNINGEDTGRDGNNSGDHDRYVNDPSDDKGARSDS